MAETYQKTPGVTSPSTTQTTAQDAALDAVIEKRVLRKLDLRLIPVLWFLFLVSFVDRGNIGNAKIQGMSKSLHLTGNRYNIAVLVFTVAYIVFGVPANIVVKRLGPRTLPVMMFIWGLFAIGQGLTKNWAGLVAFRFCMGIFEAGFVPGCAYLIGAYYKKDEFLRRYAVYFSAGIISGAFNGLLATLLAMADGAGGLKAWQWIFLSEGLITCFVAFVSWFLIVQFPEDTKMFTPEEKMVLLERLRRDGGEPTKGNARQHVYEALRDWKIWLAMLTYLGAQENASAVVAFQPTVLEGLGYTAVAAQVHSIPIYCVAFTASLACAFASERFRQRYVFALVGGLSTVVGLSIEIAQPRSAGVRYAGMFFITSGSYITMPIMVVWSAINVAKGYKRSVAFGLVIATGNAGALVSSNVFITSESPKYLTGFSVGMGLACFSLATMTALYVGLRIENSRIQKKHLGLNAEADVAVTAEKDPDWQYQL